MRGLLERGTCSVAEAALAGVVAIGLAFAAYGAHVARGGFYLDDWAYASEAELFGRNHSILSLADRLLNDPDALLSAGGRPLAALFFATSYSVFHSDATAHLVLAVVFTALMSALLFAVLRNLGLERIHAAAIAALVLVFPASDSTRFWAAADVGSLAISFFLAGLLLALAGLRTEGRRPVLLHAGALVFYALSLLTYEVAAAAIFCTLLIYRARGPWRKCVVRWGCDVAVLVMTALYLRSTTTKGVTSLHGEVDRVRAIQGQARTLVSQLGIQDGRPLLWLPAVVVVLVLAAVLGIRRPLGARVGDDLRRWVVTAGAGIAAVGVGYAVFVSATDTFYAPLSPGIGNRTNVAAAIGYVIFLYSLTVLAGLLLVRALVFFRPGPVRRAWAAGISLALAFPVAAMWIREVNQDRRTWDKAYAWERHTVAVLRETPRPPTGATVYTFGVPGETAVAVPAFIAWWDLTGAVRLIWHDPTLRGVPAASVSPTYVLNKDRWGIACHSSVVEPLGLLWSPRYASSYGKTVFIDIPSKRRILVRTPKECRSFVDRYLN
jgi:hypothetical protein